MPDAFDFYSWSHRKLIVHGQAVEVACACDELVPHLDHFAQPFREEAFPDGFNPIRGTIEPYGLEEVLKQLSVKAVRVSTGDQPFELYRDGDRYFRLENGVGLTLVDLVRRRWHSWVTPDALIDPIRLTDSVLLWPMAQLLAHRGLQMIPAAGLVRGSVGVMIVGEVPLEPELLSFIAAGYKLIGQRWVALREEQGRLAMLHLPGHVIHKSPPRAPGVWTGPFGVTSPVRTPRPATARFTPIDWIDLHACHPRAIANHAYCDVVLVCGAGRRDEIRLKEVGWTAAINLLRRSWPAGDVPPGRRGGKLVARMASRLRVADVQLSRGEADLVSAVDALCAAPAPSHVKSFADQARVAAAEQKFRYGQTPVIAKPGVRQRSSSPRINPAPRVEPPSRVNPPLPLRPASAPWPGELPAVGIRPARRSA